MRAAARGVTLALLIGSAGSLATLHVLRSDLDPVARRLSEYANGPYHNVMTAVFYAMGLALVTLSLQLGTSQVSGAARVVAGLVALAGVGLVLSGIFKTGTDSALTELLHSRASGTAVLALTVAAALYAIHPAFDDIRRWDLAIRTIAGVALMAVVISPILHDTQWSGLSQRVVWLTLMAWVFAMAWQLPTEG